MSSSSSPVGPSSSPNPTQTTGSASGTTDSSTPERVNRVGIEIIGEYAVVGGAVGMLSGGVGAVIGVPVGATIGALRYGYDLFTH